VPFVDVVSDLLLELEFLPWVVRERRKSAGDENFRSRNNLDHLADSKAWERRSLGGDCGTATHCMDFAERTAWEVEQCRARPVSALVDEALPRPEAGRVVDFADFRATEYQRRIGCPGRLLSSRS
jgi:hypothetical protein